MTVMLFLQCTHNTDSPKLQERFFHDGTHLLGHPDRSNEEVIRRITSWVQTTALPECTVFSQVRFIYIHLHKIQVWKLVWIGVLQQAMVMIIISYE